MYSDAGFRVVVDGVVQRPGNPFRALMTAMDARTWRKVSAALREALDPDYRNGDPRLFNLLEQACDAEREQRRLASGRAS
jgi:hypothetical protein